MPGRNRLTVYSRALGIERTAGWILISVLVGCVSGIGASLFFSALEVSRWFVMNIICGNHVPVPDGERIFDALLPQAVLVLNPYLLFLMPAIGGLLSGIIVYNIAPEAEGHGTDAMVGAFHFGGGTIRKRVPFVKSIASIIVLATGGSAGREGPIIQIGAGFGSWLGCALKLPPRRRRLLLLAGTAGALGAIFRAPLGGAITSIEILYREDLETEGLLSSIISSVVAYSIFTHIFGHGSIFGTSGELDFVNMMELPFYILLGIVCAVLGIIYIRIFRLTRNGFSRLPVPLSFRPAIGGLMVGVAWLACPEITGAGWGYVQEALYWRIPCGILLWIALWKMLATSFTIGSGGSGGLFGPTLFIGAMVGGAVGGAFHSIFPDIVQRPETFVLVGMASFFAGVANAPLAALIMTCEMTSSYGLVAPLMLVSVFALIFTRNWSIYEKQVRSKFDSPAHKRDFTIDVLRRITIGDTYVPYDVPPRRLTAGTPLRKVLEEISESDGGFVIVSDASGEIAGVIEASTIVPVAADEDAKDLLVAKDLVTRVSSVSPETDLHTALKLLMKSGGKHILVTDPSDRRRVVGFITHEEIDAAYDRTITEARLEE